jgi:predicted glycoside hydrolase/deacetylase ChbG (UPF0249 family)
MNHLADRRLIVNADDLGMSREVNDAIFTLMLEPSRRRL